MARRPSYEELLEKVRGQESQENKYRSAIQRMEEVYAELDSTRTTLQQKNRELEKTKGELEQEMAERKRAQEELKKAMDTKMEFMSMVSHELRTPLTAIKEGIGIVLDGSAGELNEDQKDFLATAKRNVDRLHRLINNVLDFQKLEAGRMELTKERKDINAIVEETMEIFRSSVQAKGLYLRSEIDTSLGQVACDADKITQVLSNLVNNAVKFTKNGGITVKSARDGDFVRVSVRDTGEGVTEEDLPKLFRKFQQVGDAKFRKPGGTGLGLAITQEIVRLHGGKIWVESTHGVGTEFIFTLPR